MGTRIVYHAHCDRCGAHESCPDDMPGLSGFQDGKPDDWKWVEWQKNKKLFCPDCYEDMSRVFDLAISRARR